MDYWPWFLSAQSSSSQFLSKIKPYRWNRIRVNCRHCYVGSISMKDFTLPSRDFEFKLCKCGLLALILIRTVLFKPVFNQDHYWPWFLSAQSSSSQFFSKIKAYRWNRLRVNFRHCFVGSISMKGFTLPRRDFELKLYKCGLLAQIQIRTVLFKSFFLQDQSISLESDPSNCRHYYVGSISMKDFTLPHRDFEIKLCKCGLLALILIRTVLFKPVFNQDQAISWESDSIQL